MLIKAVQRQQGLSLIEVLIALLVLSIGLLGMGALMLTSLQNVHSSAHYSVASAVVLDFEELLWQEVALTAGSDLPGLDGNGCISDDAINALAEELTAVWNNTGAGGDDPWTDADRFTMPGIALAAGTTEVECARDSAGICIDRDGGGVADVNWKTIPVTLTWNEARFAEEEDEQGETYTSEITIVCRPTFLNL